MLSISPSVSHISNGLFLWQHQRCACT
jgi:hypothetical protein